MNLDDTIVAIATPPGRGGIGVIRIAGPEALAIARPMLRLRHPLEAGRAIFGEVIESCGAGAASKLAQGRAAGESPEASADPPGRIDEVVVTYFARPHSYTTDDIIEISAHGSPVVLRHIVEIAVARGARIAEPGEFTMRAFLNGRIDLAQAEAVRDLVASRTLYQAKVAAQQLGGALSHRLAPVKQTLVELIAALEAGIDFAEDDISIMPAETILERMAEVRIPLEQLAASFAYGKIVHQGLTLAIVGRPNVGKSSLFNCLVERERAIVTASPGTTRDLVTETVSIGGIPVHLVDTAGIRRAVDEAESIGIRKSMEVLADADLVLVVLDSTQPVSAEDEDEELLHQVNGRRAIIVANKSDLAVRDFDHALPCVRTSAVTGAGISELRTQILHKIGGAQGAEVETGFLTSVRHQSLVEQSLVALDAAKLAVRNKIPHEMLLLDLYNALRPLDQITGATTTDDILNLIFSTFCIGK